MMKNVRNTAYQIVRWLARLGSIGSVTLLFMFIFGGNESMAMQSHEVLGFIFFPVCIIVGMFVGWILEATGGAITLLGLCAFYVRHYYISGDFPIGPYFLLFALPGILFLIAGLLDPNCWCANPQPQASPSDSAIQQE